jgi:hypothetical protein
MPSSSVKPPSQHAFRAAFRPHLLYPKGCVFKLLQLLTEVLLVYNSIVAGLVYADINFPDGCPWDPGGLSVQEVSAALDEGCLYYLWHAQHSCHTPPPAATALGFCCEDYDEVLRHARSTGSSSFHAEVAYGVGAAHHYNNFCIQTHVEQACLASALDGVTPHGSLGVVPEQSFEKTEHGWIIGHHPEFSPDQIDLLKSTLVDLKGCFAYSMSELTGYTGALGHYRIPLTCSDNTPIWTKPRPHSVAEYAVQDEKCRELLDAGIIVPSHQTQYASDVVIAAKKDAVTGEWTDKRHCQDFRPLNKHMVKDYYRLPLADEIFDAIGTCKFFSSLDCRSGFYQLPICPEDQAKTAFWWRGQLFQFTRMPFGVHSAPQTWQRIMDAELRKAGCYDFARAFVDDILIFSSTAAEHIEHVRKVLTALSAVGIKLHPEKSRFGCSLVEFLGFNVSQYGLTPHHAKVAAIAALKAPSDVSELRSVLGLMSYYRRFIPNFSAVAEPLNSLLQKNVPFQWGPEQQTALDTLKRMLTTEGLALKRVDPTKPLLLFTDWSKKGIGAVLAQVDADGNEHICACISRSLNKHERNYCSFKGELLAVVWACQTFRQYLHGVHVTVITDHEPLKWLISKKDLTGQYGRWAMILSDYDMTVVHRAGQAHANADALSRMPSPSDQDVSGARMDEDVVVCSNACVFCPTSFLASVSAEFVSPLVCLADLLSLCPLQLDLDDGYSSWDWDQAGSMHTPSGASSDTQPGTAAFAVDCQVMVTAACYAAASCDVMRFACATAAGSDFISSYDPEPLALLAGNTGSVCDDAFNPTSRNTPEGQRRINSLHRQAVSWRTAAAKQLQSAYIDPAMYQDWRPACIMRRGKQVQPCKDQYGVMPTAAICTHVIGPQVFQNAESQGLVVLELFGGICSGLEMVLRSGLPVHKYLYCDSDPLVRRIAAHRLDQLSSTYPALLPPESYRHAFTALPQDVSRITTVHLVHAGALNSDQWMVVAGFECQDLSPAGSGKGLSGEHSITFFPLKRVLGALQQLQPQKPPGYLIENTYLRHDFGAMKNRSLAEYEFITQCIGHPVACDAAQFGSYAHRLRHYWTNLAASQHLKVLLDQVERPPGLKVASILGPGRTVLAAQKSDVAPFYRCNVRGEPLSALPTFTSYRMSRAFKVGQPGAVYDAQLGWTEPTAAERELAMGFDSNSTYVPAVSGQLPVSEADRCAVLGRAMDMNAISGLFAMCYSLYSMPVPAVSPSNPAQADTVHAASHAATTEQVPAASYSPPLAECVTVDPLYNPTLYCMAAIEEDAACGSSHKDVWQDPVLLDYIKAGSVPPHLTPTQVRQLQRRARVYQWVSLSQDGTTQETLYRRFPDGSTRIVPPPSQRTALVESTHVRTGHFGEKRTIQLLLTSWWWYGLYRSVYDYVKGCSLCRRTNATFTAKADELQPLPIMPMMYRWGCDLCGEFLPTKNGNKYIMVCIEYFTKHVEIIPIPDKQASTTARAFLSHVVSRFGACAEVVTDQGSEWRDSFDTLLESCFISHRVTAPNHPQADGLAERIVQTIKRGLRKYCAQVGNVDTWDEGVHWLALGYRCSPQASTKLSPYELLYARQPVIPPAIVQRLSTPLDFDDPDLAFASLQQRAQLVQQMCPEAMANLHIAQQRDTKRYAMVRSGSYKPALVKFWPGQFVYVQQHDIHNTLQIKARPDILRVVRVRPGGQVTLQGKCGNTIEQNITNLAPCHIPHIDPTIDPTLGKPPVDLPCEVCRSPYDDARMLLCSNCATGWHTYCLTPRLNSIPAGTWLCPYCVSTGVDPIAVAAREAQNEEQRQAAVHHIDDQRMFNKQHRRMLAEAESLHGRYIIYPFPGPRKSKVPTWGLVHYKGPKFYPRCLRVHYPGGQHFDVTLRSVRPYLQGAADRPPANVVINAPDVAAGEESTAACVITSLQPLAPPNVDLQLVASQFPSLLACHAPILPADMAVLHTVVDPCAFSRAFDPIYSPHTGNAAQMHFPVTTPLLVNACSPDGSPDKHICTLQPQFWQDLQDVLLTVDAIICSPWFTGDALAQFLTMCITATPCVFLKVPWCSLTHVTPYMASLLGRLQRAGRLHFVYGLPSTSSTPPTLWLCVFEGSHSKEQLLELSLGDGFGSVSRVLV